MDVDIIFKIAAIGVVVGVLHTLVSKAGKEEIGYLLAVVALVVVGFLVFDLVNSFFISIKTMFNL
ncbi:MAG TPA: stage III sporulation protein AC [Firmicutes bacterium]|jgi:stage III sporulation protein AC|nr:stage III sporulation protein AC [Bacillota bacterium]